MSKHEDFSEEPSGNGRNTADTDSIARLMQLAGPRPDVPEDLRKRVHAAVRNEWQNNSRRRRTLRWGMPFALAAAALVAALVFVRAPEVGVAPIASVVLVDGNGAQRSAGLLPGADIFPGVEISTGDFGIALATNDGLSIRLAADTTVTFESGESMVLDAGRVYADTGQSVYDQRTITIKTAVGFARDIGTRFAVAFGGGSMQVAVREGKVDVATQRDSYTAEAGDLLTVDPNHDVVFDEVSVYDSSWDWATALAPAFDIDNRSLLDLLKWAARETGRELVFESDEVRMAAMATILSGGPVADFAPMEAVAAVMPTTSRFEYSVDAQRILIRSSSRQ